MMWMRVIDGRFAGEWVNVPDPFLTIIIPEFPTAPAAWSSERGMPEPAAVKEHRYTPVRYAHRGWRCQQCGKPFVLWRLTKQWDAPLPPDPWLPEQAAVDLEVGEELTPEEKRRLAERYMDRYAARWWMQMTGWVK